MHSCTPLNRLKRTQYWCPRRVNDHKKKKPKKQKTQPACTIQEDRMWLPLWLDWKTVTSAKISSKMVNFRNKAGNAEEEEEEGKEDANQSYCHTQSHTTDTRPASHSADPVMPSVWQAATRVLNFKSHVWFKSRFETWALHTQGWCPNHSTMKPLRKLGSSHSMLVISKTVFSFSFSKTCQQI